MNYTRSKLRGIQSVEQAGLLQVKGRVFLLTSLFSDIVAKGGFSAMLTHCTDIRTVAPELTAPQFLLHAGHTRKNFAGRDALDHAHDFSRAIAGYALDEKMDMVSIRTDFEKFDFVALGDIQADCFQDLIHFFTEDDSSVFSRTHDMVE